MDPAGRFDSHLSADGQFKASPRMSRLADPPRQTGLSSYGLPVRLRLLSTPPHSDAVTFDFGAVTSSGADLHHTDKASSRTTHTRT